jgi:Resolvase, N terminal domain
MPGPTPQNLMRSKDPACRPACERSLGELDRIIGQRHRRRMNELLVGHARVSTEQQDLTAQRNGLHALGVGDDRIYVDHGLTGANRDRPGLRLALAACRAGDTLVVTKLDRLARSLPDARDILDELTTGNVKLSLGGSIHDPTDPVGRLLQRARHGGGIRIRPDPDAHPRRDESCKGERPAARQAAQTEAEPGQTPARAARPRHLHPSRTRRASVLDGPRSTALSTGCGLNRSNLSGPPTSACPEVDTPSLTSPQLAGRSARHLSATSRTRLAALSSVAEEPCAGTSATDEPQLGGLSEFGRVVVAEMNLCGTRCRGPLRSETDNPGLGSVPL